MSAPAGVAELTGAEGMVDWGVGGAISRCSAPQGSTGDVGMSRYAHFDPLRYNN